MLHNYSARDGQPRERRLTPSGGIDFFFTQNIQTGCAARPVSTIVQFLADKVAGKQNRSLISIWCLSSERVELYFQAAIYIQGVLKNLFALLFFGCLTLKMEVSPQNVGKYFPVYTAYQSSDLES